MGNPGDERIWVIKRKNSGEILRHLPLHLALELSPTPDVVEALLTAYADSIRCIDHQGLLPFEIAFNNKSDRAVLNTMLEAMICPENMCLKDCYGKELLTDYSINPTEIFRLIEMKCWKDCINHVEHFPEEVSIWVFRSDSNGSLRWRRLPLHAAIVNGAPNNVIRSLLTAYPESVKHRDDQGMLPLKLAQSRNAKMDVIETLAQTSPSAALTNGLITNMELKHLESPPKDNSNKSSKLMALLYCREGQKEQITQACEIHVDLVEETLT